MKKSLAALAGMAVLALGVSTAAGSDSTTMRTINAVNTMLGHDMTALNAAFKTGSSARFRATGHRMYLDGRLGFKRLDPAKMTPGSDCVGFVLANFRLNVAYFEMAGARYEMGQLRAGNAALRKSTAALHATNSAMQTC